ncbi:hypothetical protein GR183_21470 [Stappia sp. GBMRC 2046]|uniref:HEPN domain-containing protein n=1 Tax=Stappia sediminis TaxID=2692190 RepID=A0A7X3SA19_9HYPH|nr:hypothetical protein [Stappia sediminis]MXN67483.1 hypothetical protein [Stappia sediminis]
MAKNVHKLTTAMAIRYLDAARVVWKNSPDANAFWEPLNHLLSMSAELTLKAFLEREGVSEKELKRASIRHSLNALLLLAVNQGLRTTRDVADAIMAMDEAHSSHAYRYIPRPTEGEALTVYSAHPAVAFTALQELLDQCATDTHEIRARTNFPEEWPPALQPVRPITTRELEGWIEEKKSLLEWAETKKTRGAG